MPQKIKDLCIASYEDIAPRIEKSGKGFTYEGVTVTPIRTTNGTDLKFSCGGYTVLVQTILRRNLIESLDSKMELHNGINLYICIDPQSRFQVNNLSQLHEKTCPSL